jgi:hypothetical protein
MKLSSSINRILSLSSHERKSSLDSGSSHNVEGQRYRVKVTRRSLPRSRSFHSPKPTPPIAGSTPEKVKQPRRKSAKENGVRVYLGSIGPAESNRPARRSSLKATSSYDNETRQLYEYVPDAGGKAASTEAPAPVVPTFAQEQISRSRQHRRASMGAVDGVREEPAPILSTAHKQRRRASMGGSCHEPLSSTTPNHVTNAPAVARPRRMSLGSRASKEAAHERAMAEKQQQELKQQQEQLKQQQDDEATAILLAKMRELDAQLASGSQHKPRSADFAYL